MAHEWMTRAECLDAEPESFFPVGKGGPADEQVAYVRREFCGPCGVRGECLSYALTNFIADGIWGGLTGGERAALKRRQSRARAAAAVAVEPLPAPAPRPKRGMPVQRGSRALVDADVARRLIADSGLPSERIALRCGLDKDTVWRLRSGMRKFVTQGTLDRLERGLAAVAS